MTSDNESKTLTHGILYALGCYGMWGFFPVYWKQLTHVGAMEILAHRMTWSLLLVSVLLVILGKLSWLKTTSKKVVGTYFLAATFLAVNWGTYIWAVNEGFVVETALGYFINPLINVLFGALFLGERLRRGQWLSVLTAALGVLYLTWTYGQPPWISLVLASTFGIYGLLKKKAPLGALEGLSLETALLFLPALAYLIFIHINGQGAMGTHATPQTNMMLAFSGVATVLPLLCFAAAVRRLSLSVVGVMQYIGPTIQFFLGVYLYNEPFSGTRLVGFVLIWMGLILFTAEGLLHKKKAAPSGAASNN